MKRKLSLAIALILAGGLLAGCKAGGTLSTFVTAPDAGTSEGYEGGTPVTLLDGTPVTTPDGTPVTTPVIKGAKSNGRTSTSSFDSSDPANPVGGTTIPGDTTNTTTFGVTGTTAVTAKPNVNKLAFPKSGVYGFHETITPDDGSPADSNDTAFRLTGNVSQVVRVQEVNGDGSPLAGGRNDYYEESHLSDGLWLTNSAVQDIPCLWSPKAASLPQAVIDGGKVSTDSTCTTTIGDKSIDVKLTITIKFKALKTVVIGGKSYKAIDVTRSRVAKQGEGITFESFAVDTYAFELGMRIATSDHTTQTNAGQVTASTRNLTLTSLPA